MGFIKQTDNLLFETEASWSYGDKNQLCLDTGDWRTARPVVNKDKCNSCGICVLYCPPQCMVDDGNYYKANLAFCKGCGVCATECPKKAISMTSEEEYADECTFVE